MTYRRERFSISHTSMSFRYLLILCRNQNHRLKRRIPPVDRTLQREDAVAASGINVTGNSM